MVADKSLLVQHTYVDQSPLVARRLGFASLPLAVLVILMGTQSVNMLIAMHADDWSPWNWTWQLPDMSNEDWINIAKWVALAAMFWVWSVTSPVNLYVDLELMFLLRVHSTVVIKIIMGVRLLSYATSRRAGMESRISADSVNDFGRDPIGEGKDERVRIPSFQRHPLTHSINVLRQKYNRDLKTLLDNKRDDAAPVAEIGERKPEQNGKPSSGGGGGGDKKKRLELEEITRFTMVKRIW